MKINKAPWVVWFVLNLILFTCLSVWLGWEMTVDRQILVVILAAVMVGWKD